MRHFLASDPGISGRICLSFSLIFFLFFNIFNILLHYKIKKRFFPTTLIGEENLK